MMKLKLMCMFVIMALTGCGTFNQAYTAYGSVALTNAQQANDNVISTWKVAACATPLSAVLRNPEIIPALKALCVPSAEAVPSSLLDMAGSGPVVFSIGKK